jgi:hypothetical protein
MSVWKILGCVCLFGLCVGYANAETTTGGIIRLMPIKFLAPDEVNPDAGAFNKEGGTFSRIDACEKLDLPSYTLSPAEAEFDGLTAGLGTIQLCL